MKYLIFDCECIWAVDKIGKIVDPFHYIYSWPKAKQRSYIWQFGYILLDENFKIIKEEDINVNPIINLEKEVVLPSVTRPSFWTRERLEKISKIKIDFTDIHKIIDNLIDDDVMIINQGLVSDIQYIKSECGRYNLEYKEIKGITLEGLTKYYMSVTGNNVTQGRIRVSRAKLYKGKATEESGLEHTAKALGIECNNAHDALYDCTLVMNIVKKYCEDLKLSSVNQLIELSMVQTISSQKHKERKHRERKHIELTQEYIDKQIPYTTNLLDIDLSNYKFSGSKGLMMNAHSVRMLVKLCKSYKSVFNLKPGENDIIIYGKGENYDELTKLYPNNKLISWSDAFKDIFQNPNFKEI